MKRCARCRRHIRAAEPRCPFCERAVVVVAAALAIAAGSGCSDRGEALGGGDQTSVGGDDDPANDRATSSGDVDGASATSTSGPSAMTSSTDAGETSSTDDPSWCEGGDCNGFIYGTPDGGGVSFECDLFAQDCPWGNKCLGYFIGGDAGGTNFIAPGWNATRCSPLARVPAQLGDPCQVDGDANSGIDDCDVGLMCWNVDADGVGRCEDVCQGSADNPTCPTEGDVCSIANDGAVVLCLPSCQPLLADCVVANEACFPINDDWTCVPDASADGGSFGDPCDFLNACDPGLACIAAEAFTACGNDVGCCTTICELSDLQSDATCAALDPGQACETWYIPDLAPEGYENVGVCAVPR